MTSVFSKTAALAGVLLFVSHAFAFAPMAAPVAKTDFAEVCTSTNGQFQAIRGFKAGETLFVEYSNKPGVKPVVQEGIRFDREKGDVQKNVVSFDMFELMVEPFGGAPKARATWKAAYEEIFEGRVLIYKPDGKPRGVLEMSCNAALIEYL